MKLLLLTCLLISPLSGQNHEYWNGFYEDVPADIESPSKFAQTVLPLIPKDSALLELGCGNGRDANYFAKHHIKVYACDLCKNVIDKLQSFSSNPTFFVADFTNLGSTLDDLKIGAVYSRFTLHSISKKECINVIQWSYDHLQPKGLFLIEARSIHDPLYGKGELVEKHAYLTDHYRRFIVLEELVADLKNAGFIIQSAEESQGFAPYKCEDPPIIRVIATR